MPSIEAYHHHSQTPDDIHHGHIIKQIILSTHHKGDFGLQKNAVDCNDKANAHIGYTLRSIFRIGQHTQRENLVVQLKDVRQVVFGCVNTEKK